MSVGKFFMPTSVSLLPVHSIAKLAYGTKKIMFAPFCLPRSLLHWTANTTKMCLGTHLPFSPGNHGDHAPCATEFPRAGSVRNVRPLQQFLFPASLRFHQQDKDYLILLFQRPGPANTSRHEHLCTLDVKVLKAAPLLSVWLPGLESMWCPSTCQKMWHSVSTRCWGRERPLLCQPCCHAWLPTPLPRVPRTHGDLQRSQQNCMCRETLVRTAVIQQRGGDTWKSVWLKELWVTAERKHGIYCHMGEEKRSHVILGYLNIGIMTHWKNY